MYWLSKSPKASELSLVHLAKAMGLLTLFYLTFAKPLPEEASREVSIHHILAQW